MTTICFISSANYTGGAERSLQELVLSVAGLGFRVILIAPTAGPMALWAEQNEIQILIHDFSTVKGVFGLNWSAIFRFSTFLKEIEKSYGVDVFHSNDNRSFAYLALANVSARKIAHHRDVNRSFANRLLYLRLDKNIFISEFCKEIGGSPSNGVVILNAISLATDLDDSIERTQSFAHKSIVDNYLYLAMFGRFVPWKGHHLALEALTELKARGIHVKLDIWGTAHSAEEHVYLDNLKEVSARHSLSVSFPGFNGSPMKIFNHYHGILHPSFLEPFGRVPVEGFLQEVPVIGHASGGTVEIFSLPSHKKLLFEDYKASSLAEAIYRTFLDPDPHRRITIQDLTAIRHDAERRFSVERLSKDVTELYNILL